MTFNVMGPLFASIYVIELIWNCNNTNALYVVSCAYIRKPIKMANSAVGSVLLNEGAMQYVTVNCSLIKDYKGN